jgi:addiction module HigA family antidote
MKHEELTQQDLAERMDVPRQRLSGIINKRRRISADTAHRLARVLDTTPQFWMNLQTKWDLWEEQEKKGDEFAELKAV